MQKILGGDGGECMFVYEGGGFVYFSSVYIYMMWMCIWRLYMHMCACVFCWFFFFFFWLRSCTMSCVCTCAYTTLNEFDFFFFEWGTEFFVLWHINLRRLFNAKAFLVKNYNGTIQSIAWWGRESYFSQGH